MTNHCIICGKAVSRPKRIGGKAYCRMCYEIKMMEEFKKHKKEK
jgi:hypothetical protein